MSPWAIVLADLRAMRWVAWVVPLVVAVAVAVGVAVSAQEAGLRHATARAADDFDLVVGAPGSGAQLVLSTVYLQPEALPLAAGTVLAPLAIDPRVAAFAPIAFGDVVRGYPVVGTTAAFAGRWGRLTPAEGRLFAGEGEAVVGADVRLTLGETVTPSHGAAGHAAPPGEESDEEHAHRHEAAHYEVVGRLPRLGTPWDRAILVPIESVWEIHGLGNGHRGEGRIGPPFEAEPLPGVPAVVVKPRSVADAYALRALYRQGGTMALFPAEILVDLYRVTGDVARVLVLAAALNDALVFVAVCALFAALVGVRRRRYAVLRALGAPRAYVLLAVWLGAAALLTAGCLLGLGLAWAVGQGVAGLVAARTGLTVSVTIGAPELAFVGLLIVAGSLAALGPAWIGHRVPPGEALRGG